MCGKITFTPYTKEERDALIEACGLTDRQKEVFVTRAQTDSLIATAQRLHISPETVKRLHQGFAAAFTRFQCISIPSLPAGRSASPPA